MNDETTNTGLEHSESEDSTNTDPLNQGQSASSDFQEEGESIPAKFVGKSAAEIIASYQELESRYGQQGTEKSLLERQRNEAATKAAQYEAALSQVSQQGKSVQQSHQNQDPIQVFEEAWQNQGPVEAIKQVIRLNQQQAQQAHQQRNFEDTKSYVERQKKENPEFMDLLPEMESLAQQYEPFLAPEVRTSKHAVDMMFNLAKAKNISKYTEAEAAKISAKTEVSKTKKRMSGVESSSASQGESTTNFSELSTADMEKLLGFANK